MNFEEKSLILFEKRQFLPEAHNSHEKLRATPGPGSGNTTLVSDPVLQARSRAAILYGDCEDTF